MSEESAYLAYMVRLRRVWRDGQPVWQASVESPHTGERRAFASPEALFAFLLTAMQGSRTWESWEAGAQPQGTEIKKTAADELARGKKSWADGIVESRRNSQQVQSHES